MRTVRLIVAGLFAMLIGSTAWTAGCDGFTDVDSGASYCAAVAYLKDHGITLGCTGTTYCPDAFVTRAQMSLFLQRMGQADPTNILGDHTTAIGGGLDNTATGAYSVVGGGFSNSAAGGLSATVGGGHNNSASGAGSVVMGGTFNIATGNISAIAGGDLNTASGVGAFVAGGLFNDASALRTFSAGHNASADQQDCALFALWSTSTMFQCNAWTNVFRIGADNGMSVDYGAQTDNGNSNSYVYIGPRFAGRAISTGTGAYLSTGGTWTNFSDRAEKTDLDAVDSRAVLDRVLALPMDTWRYKEETGQRHLGPMAQDFYAAFGLGADDKHITTIDEGGVALAAIQGLNAKLEAVVAQQSRELAQQANALAEIRAQLAVMAAAH